MTFGEEIRRLRLLQERDLISIANAMGWSKSYQSGLELNKQARPCLETAIRLIDEVQGDREYCLYLLNKDRQIINILQPKSKDAAYVLAIIQSRLSESTSPESMKRILNDALRQIDKRIEKSKEANNSQCGERDGLVVGVSEHT